MKNDGINIGLGSEERGRTVGVLNTALSDEVILYHRTRKYHWLVRGREFASLHKLFQEQYEALETIIDDLAERIVSLGGLPHATFDEWKSNARLEEDQAEEVPDTATMIDRLKRDHETIISALRDDIDVVDSEHRDRPTSDVLSELLNTHLKMAWMLRATAEKEQ